MRTITVVLLAATAMAAAPAGAAARAGARVLCVMPAAIGLRPATARRRLTGCRVAVRHSRAVGPGRERVVAQAPGPGARITHGHAVLLLARVPERCAAQDPGWTVRARTDELIVGERTWGAADEWRAAQTELWACRVRTRRLRLLTSFTSDDGYTGSAGITEVHAAGTQVVWGTSGGNQYGGSSGLVLADAGGSAPAVGLASSGGGNWDDTWLHLGPAAVDEQGDAAWLEQTPGGAATGPPVTVHVRPAGGPARVVASGGRGLVGVALDGDAVRWLEGDTWSQAPIAGAPAVRRR